jgi:hypothetical protein
MNGKLIKFQASNLLRRSHIASVLWYLGFARHNEKQLYGVRNWGEFVEDAQQVDNSDSESESSTIEE